MIITQPRDVENNIIDGSIFGIPTVINTAVVSGTWTPIVMSALACREILMQPRDQITWYFSNVSNGSTYYTFWNGSALKANVVLQTGAIIGYVQPSVNTVVEVLVGI